MEKLGYIDYTPYKGATLTDDGMKIAQKITRKHRILEKFLSDVLKIKEENIHDQACEMEHTLSDEAERSLCNMLNNPDLCPDNKVIPACNFDFDSCAQCYSLDDFDQIVYRQSNLLCIAELNSPTEGTVSFIRGDMELLDDIADLGIAIGDHIRYEYSKVFDSDDYYVAINGNDLRISSEIANNIFISI